MKCYLQTTMLHIHSAEARPKAKSQEKPRSKSQTKSQEPSEAKSQKPKAQCQKQSGHANWRWLLQNAANGTQIRDFGSNFKPEAGAARSPKPKASQEYTLALNKIEKQTLNQRPVRGHRRLLM